MTFDRVLLTAFLLSVLAVAWGIAHTSPPPKDACGTPHQCAVLDSLLRH